MSVKAFPYFLIGTGISAGGVALGLFSSGGNVIAPLREIDGQSVVKVRVEKPKTQEEINRERKKHEEEILAKICSGGKYNTHNESSGRKEYSCSDEAIKDYFLKQDK